jgi:hypothetical protein
MLAGMVLAISATAVGADPAGRAAGPALLAVPLYAVIGAQPSDWLTEPAESPVNWQLDLPAAQQAQLEAASLLVVPRGSEMSAMFGAELDRIDRRFRARAVRWFDARSQSAGVISDFLIHGSDTGLHLDVQSAHSLVLRWDSRF